MGQGESSLECCKNFAMLAHAVRQTEEEPQASVKVDAALLQVALESASREPEVPRTPNVALRSWQNQECRSSGGIWGSAAASASNGWSATASASKGSEAETPPWRSPDFSSRTLWKHGQDEQAISMAVAAAVAAARQDEAQLAIAAAREAAEVRARRRNGRKPAASLRAGASSTMTARPLVPKGPPRTPPRPRGKRSNSAVPYSASTALAGLSPLGVLEEVEEREALAAVLVDVGTSSAKKGSPREAEHEDLQRASNAVISRVPRPRADRAPAAMAKKIGMECSP